MTAAADAPSARSAPVRLDGARSTLGAAVRSELTKLRSVRSTGWSLVALTVITIGLGVLIAFLVNHTWPHQSVKEHRNFDATSTGYAGLGFGQLAIAVLGVLVVTSEYSTGGIRTSLAAVPNRMRFLAAKILSFTLVSAVVGLVIAFATFFASQPFFAKRGIGASLNDGAVVRAVIGAALYILVSGLFGLALGLLLRHTAGAITAVALFLFVLPIVFLAIPGSVGAAIERYWTSQAGQQITYVHQSGNHLGPWMGLFIYCVWFLVPLAVGAVLLQRRDA